MNSGVFEDEGRAGFTVLELLIVMCLLGLLSTYAVSALHGVHQMEGVVKRIEARNSAEAAQRYVHQLLSGARSVVAMLPGQSQPVVVFHGSAGQLELVGASDSTLEIGGLYHVMIAARERADGLKDLITTRKLLRNPAAGEEVLTLMEGIAEVQFRYFGEASPQSNADWHSQWVRQERLPKLIEVTVSMPKGERQIWPRLVARLECAP
jgi:prepilin-type N-terminal cleavage/methylation domain-containing protein